MEEYTYDSGKLSSSSVIFEPIWLLLHSCPFPHLKCQRLFKPAFWNPFIQVFIITWYFSIAACKKKTSGIQGKSPGHLLYRFRYPWGPWGLRFSPWGLRFSPWDLRSSFWVFGLETPISSLTSSSEIFRGHGYAFAG